MSERTITVKCRTDNLVGWLVAVNGFGLKASAPNLTESKVSIEHTVKITLSDSQLNGLKNFSVMHGVEILDGEEKSTEKVKVGKYEVDKKLLEAYLDVYVEHGVLEPKQVGLALQIGKSMMLLHGKLRMSVGLEGMWSAGHEDDFDKELSKLGMERLDKDKRMIQQLRSFRVKREAEEKKA